MDTYIISYRLMSYLFDFNLERNINGILSLGDSPIVLL